MNKDIAGEEKYYSMSSSDSYYSMDSSSEP
jgi:hypothetical protein